MVSPGSARMVHLHSPLLPRPPAPAPPPAPGDSPLGKSKLEMSPLEPLRVPPHVSSAVSHQKEKQGGDGEGGNRHMVSGLFQSYYSKFNMGIRVASGIKHLYLSLQINANQRETNVEADVRAAQDISTQNIICLSYILIQVVESSFYS